MKKKALSMVWAIGFGVLLVFVLFFWLTGCASQEAKPLSVPGFTQELPIQKVYWVRPGSESRHFLKGGDEFELDVHNPWTTGGYLINPFLNKGKVLIRLEDLPSHLRDGRVHFFLREDVILLNP